MTAVLASRTGQIYAATAPNGAVYRIGKDGYRFEKRAHGGTERTRQVDGIDQVIRSGQPDRAQPCSHARHLDGARVGA